MDKKAPAGDMTTAGGSVYNDLDKAPVVWAHKCFAQSLVGGGETFIFYPDFQDTENTRSERRMPRRYFSLLRPLSVCRTGQPVS